MENGKPVLNLSISGLVNNDRISRALPNEKLDIWQLSVKNPEPDILKTKENLYHFRQRVRILLEEIKAHYKEGTVLKIFSAMPVSACIEFGRLYLPKSDMPLEIYNQVDVETGFKYAVRIEGEL